MIYLDNAATTRVRDEVIDIMVNKGREDGLEIHIAKYTEWNL